MITKATLISLILSITTSLLATEEPPSLHAILDTLILADIKQASTSISRYSSIERFMSDYHTKTLPAINNVITKTANLDELGDENFTPLQRATLHNYSEIVSLLIKAGAQVNAQHPETLNTALHIATRYHSLATIEALLNAHGIMVSRQNIKGKTPLHIAIKHPADDQERNSKLFKQLIDAGINIHLPDNTGKTALHYAVIQSGFCAKESKLSIKLSDALQKRVDVTDIDAPLGFFTSDKPYEKDSPLNPKQALSLYAIYHLVIAGANVNTEDSEKNTPLSLASKELQDYMLQLQTKSLRWTWIQSSLSNNLLIFD